MSDRKRGGTSALTDALEMYIKVVHELERERGAATVTDIAERLGVRAPSVTVALKRLADMGMVDYQKYRAVTLTRRGKRVAKRLTKTHDVLMELFVLIGVEKDIAESDACEIEHMVQEETFDRIAAFVDFLRDTEDGRRLLERFLETDSDNT
ncbi:MAG: metal-dependent transcriptional regulator [Candidatus Thorarchaeota archaeon]